MVMFEGHLSGAGGALYCFLLGSESFGGVLLELLQLELPLCISVFLAGSLWSPLLFRSARAELAHCTGDWQCEITLWDH